MCGTEKIIWEHDTLPGYPPWASQEGASGTAWGGTEGKVKAISTLSYHTNSICWCNDQPPEAVLGLAPCGMSNTHGTAWSVLQHLQQPSSARSTVYHWICGTLSRSCLLLLLSLIAVQNLTRKTQFFCCTWGTRCCGGWPWLDIRCPTKAVLSSFPQLGRAEKI